MASDDVQLIDSFLNEFSRLQHCYSEAFDCPRYSREDIEQMECVDFDMLNTETQLAVEAQQLPYCPVYETHTTVKVVQKKYNPVAAFDIGVDAVSGEETDILGVIVPRGQSLPCTMTEEFKAYADERDFLSCDILYGTASKASRNTRLKTRPIKEIIDGCSSEEFTIQIYCCPIKLDKGKNVWLGC